MILRSEVLVEPVRILIFIFKSLANSVNPEQTYINEIMPIKLELNKQYINEMSLLTDLKIIFKTFIN